jgi:acylphosphatase
MTWEIIVTGRVQGVGYRRFVFRTAEDLGIVGHVGNHYDGSVRIVASGSPETLEYFAQCLHQGSRYAEVDEVIIQPKEVPTEHHDFTIRS